MTPAIENIAVAQFQRLNVRTSSEIIRAVATMTQSQHQEIERLAVRTNSARGDLLRLARECSQNGGLIHLGQLDRFAAGDMVDVLRSYDQCRRLMRLRRN